MDEFSDVDLDDIGPASDFVTPNFEASQDPPAGLKRIWTPPTRKKSEPDAPKLKKPAPRMPSGGLAGPLADMYTMIGAVLSPLDPVCGGAVIQAAPEAAKALEKLAKTNPEVRRILVGMVTTSTWGAVVTAHMPIILAVVMHHMPRITGAPTGPADGDSPSAGPEDVEHVRATG